MSEIIIDIIIIGGGATGLTAGMYAGRRGMKSLVFSKDFGGQTASTVEIENYPGIGRIEGIELMQRFLEQARQFGCEIDFSPVVKIEKRADMFLITTSSAQTYQAHSVVCAMGKSAKNLGIQCEDEFAGKGICYSAIQDPTQYVGKRVAIVGGGNSAVQAAVNVSSYAHEVLMIHRRNEFRAEKILMDRLSQATNIRYAYSSAVQSVSGNGFLESITIASLEGGAHTTYDVALLCVAIGFEVRTDCIGDLVERTSDGLIEINARCETSTVGLFAAGDITHIPYQQIVISAGEGAKAALSASAYVMQKKGIRPLKVDWGYK